MGPTPTPDRDLKTQVEHVLLDLRREFDTLPPNVVDEHVHRAERALEGARISAFVPVLVRREARDGLRRLARA
jgi:hypothetical protein